MSEKNPFAVFMPVTEGDEEPKNPFAQFMPAVDPNAPPEKKPEKKGFLDRVVETIGGGLGTREEQAAMQPLDMATSAYEGVTGGDKLDIPSIQETPEWKNLGAGQRASSVFSSGKAVDETFLEANPDVRKGDKDVGEDPNVAYKGQEPFAYFEMPGILNPTDIREGAINAAVTMIPAVGVASKLANVGRFTRGALTGLTEAGVQTGLEFGDLDEGQSKLNIGLAGAFPLAGEAISAARKGMSFKELDTFREKGKKYVQDKYDELGLDWRDLKDETLETFGFKSQGILKNDITDDAIVTIKQNEVPLTTGQATGDATLLGEEQALRELGNKRIGQTDIAQTEALQRNVVEPQWDKAQGARSEADTGEEVIGAVQDRYAVEKKRSQAFQEEKTAKVAEGGTVSSKPLTDLKTRFQLTRGKFNVDSRRTNAFPETKKLMDQVNTDIDEWVAGKFVGIDEMDGVLSDINAARKVAKAANPEGQDYAALSQMRTDLGDFMQTKFRQSIGQGDTEALAALNAMDKAGDTYKVFMQTFNKMNPDDRMGGIIQKIRKGTLDPEKAMDTIVGASNLKLTGQEYDRLIDATTRSYQTGVPDMPAEKVKQLVLEGVERRVWGDAKTSLAEKSPDQAFKTLQQVMNGNKKQLGERLYPKGSKRRSEIEMVMKTLDTIRRNPSKTKQNLQLFNNAYARMNLGLFRTVFSFDQFLGGARRRSKSKSAVDPLRQHGTGAWSMSDYLKSAAAAQTQKEE